MGEHGAGVVVSLWTRTGCGAARPAARRTERVRVLLLSKPGRGVRRRRVRPSHDLPRDPLARVCRRPALHAGHERYARGLARRRSVELDTSFARFFRPLSSSSLRSSASSSPADPSWWPFPVCGPTVVLVTHGLTLRLFLMRWFHWPVGLFHTSSNPSASAHDFPRPGSAGGDHWSAQTVRHTIHFVHLAPIIPFRSVASSVRAENCEFVVMERCSAESATPMSYRIDDKWLRVVGLTNEMVIKSKPWPDFSLRKWGGSGGAGRASGGGAAGGAGSGEGSGTGSSTDMGDRSDASSASTSASRCVDEKGAEEGRPEKSPRKAPWSEGRSSVEDGGI